MNPLPENSALSLVAVAAALCFATACQGVDEEENWPPPVQHVEEAPVLSPEESLDEFVVPPGFRVELVAAEPLVQDPVAIDMDSDGRMWVVEMRGWMTDLVDSEGDYTGRGRIVILEDTDQDGQMDEKTVFMEGLNLPRSLLVVDDGVLVAEPPHLWLARDTDGDLKADERREIRGDYGDADGNPEHMANGLTWGMDNWIHSAHYPGRLRHTDDSWVHDSTLALGQWGRTMDNHGRLYHNWNSDPLRVALLDPHYFTRNADMEEAGGADVRIGKEALEVWPIRTTLGVNRGYREGVLREDSTLRTFTAASAPTVYRGDRYPDAFQENVFVPEPAANLVRRFQIKEPANDTLEAVNPYEHAEFLASTDERFRPVNGYSAPDGTLYIVDMYRGIIQHRNFLSQYLKNHIRRRDLQKPLGLGRIYRVVHAPTRPRQEEPQLSHRSNRELVEFLDHPNGWWRDTAQRLLVERRATDAAPALRKTARAAENELARLHALWTLEGLDALKTETVTHALSDEAPQVRAAAVRLSEPWLRNGHTEVLQKVAERTSDPAPPVRLQLAASLGEVPPPAADEPLATLLTHASGQPFLAEAAITGLEGRELAFVQHLVHRDGWQEQKDDYARILRTLATTIVNGDDPDQINQMIELVGDQADLPAWQRLALLDGIEALFPAPRGEFEPPLKLAQKPPALDQAVQASAPEVREKARRVADRLAWPGKPGYTPPETTLLTEAAKQRFRKGKKDYQQACASCHQSSGEGAEGVAASLARSKWVLGQRKDLIRIVLDGKEGTTGLMPPNRNKLDDEEIAAILTYVRNAWDNKGSPVSPSLVEEVRNATATREEPWTEKQLRVMLH